MNRALIAMLAATALLAASKGPAVAGHEVVRYGVGCWPGTTWDDLAIPETTAITSR